jgi:hypothetical protein
MIIKRLIVFVLIISLPQFVMASEEMPVKNFRSVLQNNISDTTLPGKKGTGKIDEKPDNNIIKVVPKARRQPIPLPMVKVNPVKIIKPKIIRPVIKVLH